MNEKQYLGRSIRYLLKLVLLVALLYALLFVTGHTGVSAEYLLIELVTSWRGLLLLVVLAVLAGVYPTFGYVKKVLPVSMAGNREKIVLAFMASGYSLRAEEPGRKMVFRITSPLRRAANLFDDKIEVTSLGNGIVLEGKRKDVVTTIFRIETGMLNDDGSEKENK